jgi:hypothetical protein
VTVGLDYVAGTGGLEAGERPIAENINVRAHVSVANGPSLAVRRQMTVDAIDKLTVVVPADTTEMAVDVQPSPGDMIRLLVVLSDVYSEALTYQVDVPNGSDPLPELTIDAPRGVAGGRFIAAGSGLVRTGAFGRREVHGA